MKKRVLVVDDSAIVLERACDVLGQEYDVATAPSANAADAIIFSSRPDIIILDVMMPTLDGDKKARILKSDESTRDIPILLMSSKPEVELARLVAESGAEGFIRKPFTSGELIEKIEGTFSR